MTPVVEAIPEPQHAQLQQTKIIINAAGEIILKILHRARYGITQLLALTPEAQVLLLITVAEVQIALHGLITVAVEVLRAVQVGFLAVAVAAEAAEALLLAEVLHQEAQEAVTKKVGVVR